MAGLFPVPTQHLRILWTAFRRELKTCNFVLWDFLHNWSTLLSLQFYILAILFLFFFFFAFFAVDVFLIVGVHPSKNPSSLSMLVQLVRNITQIILSALRKYGYLWKRKMITWPSGWYILLMLQNSLL